MTTTTITVSNATQLAAALKIATGGETIALAAGNYGSLGVYSFNPTAMVTITGMSTPANFGPAAGKAVFNSITVGQSQNLTFNGFEVTHVLGSGESNAPSMITVGYSSNLNFTNLDVHGSLNHNPIDDMSGLRVVGSHDIQIANSTFHDLYCAAGFKNVSALAVTGNTVYEVREGLDFSGIQHGLIDHNLIHSVIPNYAIDKTINPLYGDHPDMIQFWTTGTGGSSDVTISNNALLLGKGMDTHGIFITSQDSTMHSNFLIENNLVSTNNANGISVGNMNGAIIDHNTVLTSGGAKYAASLNVDVSNNVQISNNIATFLSVRNSTTTTSNNLTLHYAGANDATNEAANFANPLKPLTTSVSDFTEQQGSLAASNTAGFDMTAYRGRVSFATYDSLAHSLDAGAFLHHIA